MGFSGPSPVYTHLFCVVGSKTEHINPGVIWQALSRGGWWLLYLCWWCPCWYNPSPCWLSLLPRFCFSPPFSLFTVHIINWQWRWIKRKNWDCKLCIIMKNNSLLVWKYLISILQQWRKQMVISFFSGHLLGDTSNPQDTQI